MIDVVSIFDRSGVMVEPWRAAGFSTLTIDIEPARHDGQSVAADLLTFDVPPSRVLFAFPPCTHLASSGARWWDVKGLQALSDAMSLVNVARRATDSAGWWMIENPIGRLSTHWREPDWSFDPYEYGGYVEDDTEDAYTKRTCIWGTIPRPPRKPVDPVDGSRMHRIPPGPDRQYLRSLAPRGFARAVFQMLSPWVRDGRRAPQQMSLESL